MIQRKQHVPEALELTTILEIARAQLTGMSSAPWCFASSGSMMVYQERCCT